MSNPNSMHNFLTLIKRLEAATSRLEDIAQSAIDSPPQSSFTPSVTSTPPPPSKSAPPPAPPSAPPAAPVVIAPIPTPAPPPPAAAKVDLPETVEEYDAFIGSSLDKWLKLSSKLGGVVAEQANLVLKGHQEIRDLLLISTQAKKPDDSALQTLIQPLVTILTQAEQFPEKHGRDPLRENLSAVSNAIWFFTWFNLPGKPWKQIEEMAGAAQYYGNRIIKANKAEGGNPTQIEWTQALYNTYRDYAEYVKTYFPDGIRWNANGGNALEVAKNLPGGLTTAKSPAAPAAPGPSSAGGPPPPPPPGPPPVLRINEVQPAANAAGGLGAVFSELNQGENVTKGLKKVDKSQMTHKNPSLRASSTVPDTGSSAARGKSPAPGKKPKPESMRVKKPPKKELDGNKWIIENYEEDKIEIEVTMSHSVLITKCTGTTIILKGKGNAVTVDNSTGISLIIDTLVSTVDVIKSPKFAMQVTGTIPTVLLDQVDNAQIYLSKESIATKIFSTKTTGVNVNILEGEDEDFKEVPLPNQICSYYDEAKGEFVNEIVSHAG
ncbi:adenylate cyclase associated N terminal-domain-containing protein [Podospora australis]|uniref:Adenylyl cyclase-associated protein n=1 Tax=Podospora australis TaxID=1536484 RepID=A0AAN6X5C9_9PEZI|nr:adenylate cyclase associated N terminal-domain-containing protein [Podospora australis]